MMCNLQMLTALALPSMIATPTQNLVMQAAQQAETRMKEAVLENEPCQNTKASKARVSLVHNRQQAYSWQYAPARLQAAAS